MVLLIKDKLKNGNTGIIIALILMGVLILAPIAQLILSSIYIEGKIDILAPIKVILITNLMETYCNTIFLGIYVVIGSSIVALPAAFLMAKTELGKHRWIDTVLIIPFMTPPYIGSMGWILFFQSRGFLNQILPFTEGINKLFFSVGGLIIVMSLHIFPFLYLIIKNSLFNISENLEEAGAIHGGGWFYRFKKVTVPLLFSSYVMGSLLVFVKTISEFGTPATLGRRIGFYVLTSEIHRFISSWPISFSKANSLASVLLTTCICFLYIQNVISNKYTYKTLSGKGQRRNIQSFGVIGKIFGWGYMIFIMGISIGIPYFSIIMTSLLKLRGYGLKAGNFTIMNYLNLFKLESQSLNAFINSLEIAVLTATICAIIGTFLAIIIMKNNGLLNKIIDILSLLPNTIPSIVLVIGLILFWNAPWMKIRIYNTYWMVILTYVVLFIPYTVQYVKSSFGQIDESLLKAGKVFGGSELYVVRRILVPLIMPGIFAGWIMTFTIAFRELVAALMILPPSMETSSTYIFGQFEQGEASMGMAMAVVSVGITVFILIALNKLVDLNRQE